MRSAMRSTFSWSRAVAFGMGIGVAGCAGQWAEPEESSEAQLTSDGGDQWRCRTFDNRACSSADFADPNKRHLVIASAGFSDRERADFWAELDRVRVALVGDGAGAVWSRQKKEQLLFFGWFSGGASLPTPEAPIDPNVALGARVAKNPFRGFSLAIDSERVKSFVDKDLSRAIPSIRPMAIGVVLNSMQPDVTATAIMGGLIQRPWGIGTMTREHLRSNASYIASHELAHAGLNFADEYVEAGFEDLSIKQLDIVTPLALLDASWGGIKDALGAVTGNYSWRTSEILGHNGYVNVTTETNPSTVATRGFTADPYPFEGGFFFGKGTYRPAGKNVMNDSDNPQSPEDGFAMAHSPVQQRVVDARFGAGPLRPNDFLRAAGPHKSIINIGSTTAMMFDGHKTSLSQPTVAYEIEVGWTERSVHVCRNGLLPTLCTDAEWKTAKKRVVPDPRTVDVKASLGYGSVRLLHKIACRLGLDPKLAGVDACKLDFDETAGTVLSSAVLPVPYQTVEIPHVGGLLNPLGKAKWRFRTDNGKQLSEWTAWSELGD
jgi:hypothetical protein